MIKAILSSGALAVLLSPLLAYAETASDAGDKSDILGTRTSAANEATQTGSSVANPRNGGTRLAARGFSDQGFVMTLDDGVRLYPGAGTVRFPTDSWMVERVGVPRRPAWVLFGQGAIGGAVNVGRS